jgi:hypothetical protein
MASYSAKREAERRGGRQAAGEKKRKGGKRGDHLLFFEW